MKGKVDPNKLYPAAAAEKTAAKMKTSIVIQNQMFLSDKKRPPSVSFYKDADQFFDPTTNRIHLGIYGPMEIFEVEDEETYVSAVEFLFGHENQHVRSTASVPYKNGIMRSVHVVIEYIAKQEGFTKNFRNERDYTSFLEVDLKNKGIYVSMMTLTKLLAGLANSVEDGRIERIRSLELPGFEAQRKYFRGLEWTKYKVDNKPYKSLTELEKLNLHLNTIHSLATKGLYPKGYIAAYYGTPLMDEIQVMMPYIAKAVMAGRTRRMADNVVEIARCLAPYIYECCKANASDIDAQLQQLLAELLKHLIENMDPSTLSATSERDEEESDETPNPVFSNSDLVVTLDDETYDKLMEKAKEDGNADGMGIMVRREHPKEDDDSDEKQDGKSGSGSGSGSGGQSSDEESDGDGSGGGSGEESDEESDKDGNGGGSGKKSDKKSDKKGSGGGSDDEDGEESDDDASGSGSKDGKSKDGKDGNSNDGKSKDGKSKDKSKSGKSSGNSNGSSSSNSSSSDGGSSGDGKGSKGQGAKGGGSEEDVLSQMKEAAAKCRNEAADMIETINKSVSHESVAKSTAPIIQNTDAPITANDVKDICRNFEELFRTYKLDQQMPAVLAARAKTFRKRNERYFKSLSTPNITNLSSGGVDPSLIYGLTFGETNVFRKIGQDKKFNGCVYVLIDNSGSMSGNKKSEACKAAAVIEEGFKGIIPMKITAFDDNWKVTHEVIKGWEESQKLNCCWNFANHGRNGGGTPTSESILIAQREILSRSEEKKLIIVLTDGEPNDVEATRRAIEDSRKKGVHIFGIYFEEGRIGSAADHFNYMFQKDYVCTTLDQVDNELTKLMIKFSRS